MKIYLGADHRGFELKEKIKGWLKEWGKEYEDMGNKKYEATDDYPDYAGKVGEKVGKSEDRGVAICGSGIGVNIVVNKYQGVRGMIGFNQEQVRHGVEFDKANVLCLAADYVKDEEAKEMVKVFLETRFGGAERNVRRINKINQIETGDPKPAG